MFPEHWDHDRILRHALAEILVNQQTMLRKESLIMSALDDLKVAVNSLQAAVQEYVAAHPASEAELTAVAQQVNAVADLVKTVPQP